LRNPIGQGVANPLCGAIYRCLYEEGLIYEIKDRVTNDARDYVLCSKEDKENQKPKSRNMKPEKVQGGEFTEA